jgi:hypothetical protein
VQSREREGARALTTDPTVDVTEQCAEFAVGPVIGDRHRAPAAARSLTDLCSWIGAGRVSRA